MRSMKRREVKTMAAPPADLLVCFPARSHLPLLPKPVLNSPARSSDSNRRRKKSSPFSGAGAGEMTSEPTSPKVTCAGQIKIRPHEAQPVKKWQSVMEEIERIHKNRKPKKKPGSGNSLGFKREIFQFMSCLRSFRFNLRCFRGFGGCDVTSEDEYDEEDEEEEEESDHGNSRTVFSKWFMVLQEEDEDEEEEEKIKSEEVSSAIEAPSSVPPSNALLLMRCRSAPAKKWLQEQQPKPEENQDEEEDKRKLSLKALMAEEEEVMKKKESLVVMNYGGDFYKLSSDIAKETWVVSGSSKEFDPLVRCRSWKR